MLTKHWNHQGLTEVTSEENWEELGQVLGDMAQCGCLSQQTLGTIRCPIGVSVLKVRNQINSPVAFANSEPKQ